MELKGIFSNLSDLFKAEDDQSRFVRNMLILIILGVVFLSFSNLFSTPAPRKDYGSADVDQRVPNELSEKDYAALLEDKLIGVLSQIDGVGEVVVRVTLFSGPTYQYSYDRQSRKSEVVEEDAQGGHRSTIEEDTTEDLTRIRLDSSREEPVLIRKLNPEVRGVLVAAEGASSSVVKARLVEAVQTFLDLPAHRVSIQPKKGR